MAGHDLALGHLGALDLDQVAEALEERIVGQTDIRDDEAEFDRDVLAHAADPGADAGLLVHHGGDQAPAEFHPDLVDVHLVAQRLCRGACRIGRLGPLQGLGLTPPGGLVRPPGACAQPSRARHEGQERQARHEGEQEQQDRDHAERARVAAELRDQGFVGAAEDTALRDQQGRGHRDDDGWDLRDQAVADGQDGVGLEGLRHGHAIVDGPHGHADDQVQEDDQQPGDGIALHELGGAVQRAEERRLLLLPSPPLARLLVVDGARGHVAVDRELLARHAVEGEAGADLRHPAGTLRDHDEVHDQQHAEHHDPEQQVAAHHEVGEALDDMAGGIGPGMPLPDDQLGRGDVERQAQEQASPAARSGRRRSRAAAR